MKQKLITSDNRFEWEEEVNKYLNNGWTVVPKTLQTYTEFNKNVFGHLINSFTVVVQKED